MCVCVYRFVHRYHICASFLGVEKHLLIIFGALLCLCELKHGYTCTTMPEGMGVRNIVCDLHVNDCLDVKHGFGQD